MMMTMMRSILILLVALTAVACARIESTVQNFSNLPADYASKSVVVLGYPQEIDESLEWQAYKPVFERQFAAQGFTVTDFDNADYIAFVTYGVGNPQTITEVGSIPIYGQTGSVSAYYGAGYTVPTYGIVGSTTFSYNTTHHTRTVAINLVDKATEQRLFESKATSTGSCALVGQVIDEIAQAMFQKFPSDSGKVSIESKFHCGDSEYQ